jgi:hypothetical protein
VSMTNLVKSTKGSIVCRRGFALVVIVGSVRIYIIDSELVTVGYRLATSFATNGSEISVCTEK